MNPSKQVVDFDDMLLVYRTQPWLVQRAVNIGFSNGNLRECICVIISTLEKNKNLHLRTPKTAFYYLKKDPTDISMRFHKR